VCSDMQADALTVVLQARWLHMAQEDPDAIRDRIDVVRIALTHLITEETYFTFAGPASALTRPQRPAAPDQSAIEGPR
jgi:hypothetical protein